MKRLLSNETGMTLIELLVGLGIFSMVAAGIVSAKIQQQNQHVTQIQAVEMQQSVRAVMLLMKKELRKAGYNPLPYDRGEGILAADVRRIVFTFIDDNGELETIDYAFEDFGGDADLDITKNGSLLGENITELVFTYFDHDGRGLDAPVDSPNDIRSIQISITAAVDAGHLARADASNRTRTLTSTVYLRNMGI